MSSSTPPPVRLSPIENNCYKVDSQDISNSQLLWLSQQKDLTITEVEAPLSQVGLSTVEHFLSAKGSTIKKLVLQNVKNINDDTLARLLNSTPNLENLAVQYEPEITNEGILSVVQNHPALSTLILGTNAKTTKQLVFQLLAEPHTFKQLHLDIPASSVKTDPPVQVLSKVEHLVLSGSSLTIQDLVTLSPYLQQIDKLELLVPAMSHEDLCSYVNSLTTSSLSLKELQIICTNSCIAHQLKAKIKGTCPKLLANQISLVPPKIGSTVHICFS